jgi:hypothetical protein
MTVQNMWATGAHLPQICYGVTNCCFPFDHHHLRNLTCGPRTLDAHGETFLGSDYQRTLDVVKSRVFYTSVAIDTKASQAKTLG